MCAIHDSEHCRTRTARNNSLTVFQVMLVDYGQRVVVSTEAVRSLDESLMTFPVQVISCLLVGLETPEWTDEAMQYFKGEASVTFVLTCWND